MNDPTSSVADGVESDNTAFVLSRLTLAIGVLGCAFLWFFLKGTVCGPSLWSTTGSPGIMPPASAPRCACCTIPFIHIPSPEAKSTPDKVIQASLAQFRNELFQAMQGLSLALETALELEKEHTIPMAVRLSTKLQGRIDRFAECLEKDEQTLEALLSKGFDPVLALPQSTHARERTKTKQSTNSKRSAQSTSFQFTRPANNTRFLNNKHPIHDNAYDSAGQVVAHLVRDWTILGAKVRHRLYDWCVEQLNNIFSTKKETPIKVLIPGAGLGRLAYEVASQLGARYSVEANELSPVMAAAAHAILQQRLRGTVHPFLLDRLSNEVESERRFDCVDFPDINLQHNVIAGASLSLSFTIGDFSLYYDLRPNAFGAIITCFFLDTAPNIYEYLALIHRLLHPGGVWINVGPLQWHLNALLFPASDELRDLITQAFGFRIVHWSMDSELIPYRDWDDDSFIRTTNIDGYRPLRFVAIKA